ncbi:flippase [Desulfosudis oleivorans]|uniref:Polysaccharide biosynthesis protein n=1 Tax=Desulfosudis oleivorans (strain DSM 6200 / JCM 39069 / Hxd3) TaxID=96561 RepID=A8ZU30_DESOH|nr:flippase [Desulfosudis oleivorans]ABW66342.1 polysaccharide biosynthesis protein [Desulfosudis oleivorans Hxd3]
MKIQSPLSYLPYGLRGRIEQSPDLMRILNNISWLFFDKFLRMGVGLIVSIWVARYLGPEQFGLMSYAVAFVALFSVIAGLGFNGIAVRDLVQNPSETNTTMGTAFALQALGGLFAFGLTMLTIGFVKPDDGMAKLAVSILAFLMVFNATDVVRYWFESQVQSKYVVWTESGVFLFVSAVKIGLILAKAPLIAFIWVLFAQGLVIATGLIVIYSWRGGDIKAWRPRLYRAKTLLSDSWPLILAGIAYLIYMRIDQIMLGQMVGNEAVGLYTAAVQISEVWYFIPMTITASVFPFIIQAKKKSEDLYTQSLQKLFDLMVALACIVALPITLFADWIVTSLFGLAYHLAGTALSIHIWAGIFFFLQAAGGKWFLIEGLQKHSFYRTLSGAVLNVGLNMVLIPTMGIVGAAWATIASLACASVFFNALHKRTRPLFRMQCQSFFFINRLLKQK